MNRSILTIGCLLLSGCSVLGINEGAEGELKDEKAAWLKLGIHNYSYVQQNICFCGSIEPVTITVRNDVVATVVGTTSGTAMSVPPNAHYTIPALFDFLIDSAERADKMDVTFDRAKHLPVDSNIDYVKNAIDDELRVKVSAFTQL